jgi:hypothetical protein
MSQGCGCVNTLHTGGGIETQHVGGSEYVNMLANLVIPIGFVIARHLLQKKENVKTGGGAASGGSDIRSALESLEKNIENVLRSHGGNH